MSKVITVEVVQLIIRGVFAIIGLVFSACVLPWVTESAIPWLKEKRLLGIVKVLVAAAEKQAEAGEMAKTAKKDYVVRMLESKGINVTDEVNAVIEAAVKQLDIETAKVIEAVKGAGK